MQHESKLLSLGVCANVSQIPDPTSDPRMFTPVKCVSAPGKLQVTTSLDAKSSMRIVGGATTIPNQGFHRFTTEEGVWRARVHEEEHVMPIRCWALIIGTQVRVTLIVATAHQVDHVAIVRGEEYATQSLLRLQVVTDDLLGQVSLPNQGEYQSCREVEQK
eukprot:scaffold47329_cov48-Attheya_sp.AAC.2